MWKVLARGAKKGSGQADAGSKAESLVWSIARLRFLWKLSYGAAFVDDLVEKTVVGIGLHINSVSASIAIIMLCNKYPQTLWLTTIPIIIAHESIGQVGGSSAL